MQPSYSGLNVGDPPPKDNSYVESQNPEEVRPLGSNQVVMSHEGGAPMLGLVPLLEEEETPELSISSLWI